MRTMVKNHCYHPLLLPSWLSPKASGPLVPGLGRACSGGGQLVQSRGRKHFGFGVESMGDGSGRDPWEKWGDGVGKIGKDMELFVYLYDFTCDMDKN